MSIFRRRLSRSGRQGPCPPPGTLNRLLFPGPTKEFQAAREAYGDVGRLDTLDYLYGLRPGDEHVAKIGRGVSLILGLEAIGGADERGMRTVMCTINGQLRPIRVGTSRSSRRQGGRGADPTSLVTWPHLSPVW